MIPSESVAIVWEVFAVVITLAVVAAISRMGNK